MDNKNEKIRIVKILNLPIENEQTKEVTVDIEINEAARSYGIGMQNKNVYLLADIKTLLHEQSVRLEKTYNSDALHVIDDKGRHCTLFNFSYIYREEYCFQFDFKMFSTDGHFDGINEIEITGIETEVSYKERLNLDFTYNSVQIQVEPLYATENYPKEWLAWLGTLPQETSCLKLYTGKCKIILSGGKDFPELEKMLWRLSEFSLLIWEDMFFYDFFTVYTKKGTFRLKSFLRQDLAQNRNAAPRTANKTYIQSNNQTIQSDFSKFIKFREKSGIIFDVFRTTIYSNSFREDYPLRLSQILEGLANFLEIVDTKGRDTFKNTIQLSILVADCKNEYFATCKELNQFCKRITEHRNKFSHAKANGDYLKGEDNEKYARILYTTIRVLIYKYLRGEFA